jgi:adenosylhomocysteine nucleosidase
MPAPIIILISANAEWRAVKELLAPPTIETYPYSECFTTVLSGREYVFYHSGWGKISSAAVMQFVVARHNPQVVLNLGTCGGFEGAVQAGDILLIERTFIYDIVELMGDFGAVKRFYDSELPHLLDPLPHPVRRAVIASADGDLLPEKIPALAARGAVAADWESGALAWVAHKLGVRLFILRGVSDLVHHEQGGEAYDNIELFRERTRGVMKTLLAQLPAWGEKITAEG